MKFKITAAGILNILFLSIFKWSTSSGSCLHYCKILFIYVNRRLSYCYLCKKSKMAAAAILNYNVVMLEHPRSPFVHLKFQFRILCWSSAYFSRYRDSKFCKFGLKCPFSPKSCFWRSFDSQTLFFIIKTPKRPYLTWKHAFCAINTRDRSSGVTCKREQVYKTRNLS